VHISPGLKEELVAVFRATLYFGCWLVALMFLKRMVLEEYQIAFSGLSIVFLGALVLAKAVLILERVPLGSWIRRRSAWVDVLLRTMLYSLGVLIVLLLERAFEGRHEFGGFRASLTAEFEHADAIHVWLNTICLSAALLSYNVMSVVRKHLPAGIFIHMFLVPVPDNQPQSRRSDP
jgi:hypothetical protein